MPVKAQCTETISRRVSRSRILQKTNVIQILDEKRACSHFDSSDEDFMSVENFRGYVDRRRSAGPVQADKIPRINENLVANAKVIN